MKKRIDLPEKLFPPTLDQLDDSDPQDLLEAAMSDVRPLSKRKSLVPRRNGVRESGLRTSTEDESRKLLVDFVEGKSEFDWSFHPGYREGGPEGRNSTLLRKLRKGNFAVQSEIDLHGMSRREALQALEQFLAECVKKRLRCVRIIHGKGNNSEQNEGVLKRLVPLWLSTRKTARSIIAFTSAAPTDGGLGATYVLLRRKALTR